MESPETSYERHMFCLRQFTNLPDVLIQVVCAYAKTLPKPFEPFSFDRRWFCREYDGDGLYGQYPQVETALSGLTFEGW